MVDGDFFPKPSKRSWAGARSVLNQRRAVRGTVVSTYGMCP